MSDTKPQSAKGDLFGHPTGLTFLFATEMWERFSYYGMKSLLILYMVNHLFKAGTVENVAGYGILKRLLETVFGKLEAQPLASLIYGLYGGLVYLTPVLGGLLADRAIGRRRAVLLGAILMMFGHFLMAFESLFFLALSALILGSGAFKPNIVTQVGGLYSRDDDRRDRAYAIFYVGINVGAFLSPLICGSLADGFGWSFGFAAAGAGMLISLVIYLFALPALPADQLDERRSKEKSRAPRKKRIIIALIGLGSLQSLFWAVYEQTGNTVVLWFNDHTDRSIKLFFWQTQIPVTWILSLNPLLIFAFTPLIIALWGWQAKRSGEPSDVGKMALGSALVGLSYLILSAVAWQTGPVEKASWLWLVLFFVVLTVGELYVSPIGLAFFAKAAPASMRSMLMGLWLTTSFVGNVLAGWLGSFWSSFAKSEFFC
ncbi:peptide MFS transporter [Bradyrhizobium betae]|uniref:peptide MFS transporter n=1 Tax=Bradyrhizobium betae TaxID=244734 RepID=UPI003D66D8C3